MAAPTVTSITPQAGSIFGGTTVTITGTGFSVPGLSVHFGDKLGTGVIVGGDTTITVLSPPVDGDSEADVYVVTDDGQSTVPPAARFYYFNPVSSPPYINNNIFFDSGANYVFYGDIVFAKNPLFASEIVGTGPITGGANLGAGHPVFASVSGSIMNFKTLIAGAGINITEDANTVTLAAPATFDPANSYTFTGNEQFNGGFGVNALTAVIIASPNDTLHLQGGTVPSRPVPAKSVEIQAQSEIALGAENGLVLTAFGGNAFLNAETGGVIIAASSGTLSMTASSTLDIDSVTTVEIGTSTATSVVLGNNLVLANDVQLQPRVVKMNNIPAAVAPNVLFYDSSSKAISYGAAALAGAITAVNVQYFASPGVFTYTPTTGMKYCYVQVQGGGGAGGGATGVAGARCGSGAGAGAYAEKLFAAADIGAGVSLTVGAGGSGVAGGDGNNGTASIFLTINCGGGFGGDASEFSVGGDGGNVSGAPFQVKGGCAITPSFVSQGSSAGTVFYSGQGGGSYFGGAVIGSRGNSAPQDEPGNNSFAAGAGGSGALGIGSVQAGGNGGTGVIIIHEFISA